MRAMRRSASTSGDTNPSPAEKQKSQPGVTLKISENNELETRCAVAPTRSVKPRTVIPKADLVLCPLDMHQGCVCRSIEEHELRTEGALSLREKVSACISPAHFPLRMVVESLVTTSGSGHRKWRAGGRAHKHLQG